MFNGMFIGTIRERKEGECRVGLSPSGVSTIKAGFHCGIVIEQGAGNASGFSDEAYDAAGAMIVSSAKEVLKRVQILVKVKEPLPSEHRLLETLAGETLFTFLHLAGTDKSLTEKLLANKITAIAYETTEDARGGLPILAPMSEVAGVAAVQYGAQFLRNCYGAPGLTLGYIPHAPRACVVIVGGGTAGAAAARTAFGMGSNVTLFETRQERIRELQEYFNAASLPWGGEIEILTPEEPHFSERIACVDLLIGTVHRRGERADRVVGERHVRAMPRGSVIVDISIDQGGCVWGSRPTDHKNPIFKKDGRIYCCVANIPGQQSAQATSVLVKAALPYIHAMIEKGVITALLEDAGFRSGLNTFRGRITCEAVARAHGMEEFYTAPEHILLGVSERRVR